jgi:dCMP deaminase
MISDKTFMQIAYIMAEESHCISRKVAALAVKDGRILATGINGTLKGAKNCDEVFNDLKFVALSTDLRKIHHEWSLVHEVHAEQNLIATCAKLGVSIEGATIYCTLQPCESCTKLLAASGIARIVYNEPYDLGNTELLDTLQSYDVGVHCLDAR